MQLVWITIENFSKTIRQRGRCFRGGLAKSCKSLDEPLPLSASSYSSVARRIHAAAAKGNVQMSLALSRDSGLPRNHWYA